MKPIEWEEFHEAQGSADSNFNFRVSKKELVKFDKLCKSKRFNKSGVLRVLMRRWMEIHGKARNTGAASKDASKREASSER